MSEYSVSQGTRLTLINTAGRLMALYGVDELDSRAATTARAIAKAAQESTGAIHYHFGTREDLLNAVIDYAMQPWKDDPFGNYIKEHSGLLKTSEGILQLTDALIDLFFEKIFPSGTEQSWCAAFLFKFFQKKNPVSEKLFPLCVNPVIDAFALIYRQASGDPNTVAGKAWAFMILTPLVFHAMDAANNAKMFDDENLPADFSEKLKNLIKNNIRRSLETPAVQGT